MRLRRVALAVAVVILVSCRGTVRNPSTLTVAAAANLTDVFAEIGAAFQAKTGIVAVFSYGSTAQLANQIENGAPFDIFAAADTGHIDNLIASGKLTAESRAVYALGQLALWSPNRTIHELKDLEKVRFIAIAQPNASPYGKASIEALKNSGLWERLQPKIVYANSISQARQLAASGNADAAFTAYSLVLREKGTAIKIDPSRYHPLEQALAIATASSQNEEARRFREFLLSREGRSILSKTGYLLPQ